jgi:hypothetical protein
MERHDQNINEGTIEVWIHFEGTFFEEGYGYQSLVYGRNGIELCGAGIMIES